MEISKGKMRPSLTRASDLMPAETEAKPTEARDAHGHFTAGNRTASGAGFTHAIRKSLGSKDATGAALVVARDARRLFGHTLASLPSDAAPVRALLAIYSRHAALHAYYTVRAEALGLDTPAGLKLLEVADRQSQRAERTLVTVHDLARVHAAKASNDAIDIAAVNAAAEAATERRRVEERRARAAATIVDDPSEPPTTIDAPIEETDT